MASRGHGGLELHYVQLCNALAEHVEVTAISHPEFADRLDPAVRHLPMDMSGNRRSPLLLSRLVRLLRRERFDVIHGQANKAVTLLGTLRPFLRRSALIGTLHNQKQSTWWYRQMDHAIAVSRTAAARIQGVPVSVVYNGLPMPDSTQVDLRAMFDLPDGLPIFVAIGRLVEAKGFDVLTDAVAPMKVALLIAGDGAEKARLEQRIRTKNASGFVRLIGHRADVSRLIASSDGVVVSSRKEGFSYVVAETLLLGQRLLSTDVPVANEILPRELIVPIEDPRALRERLAMLLDDPERWRELAAPAAEYAREHFTIEAMVRKTAEVYGQVAANHRR